MDRRGVRSVVLILDGCVTKVEPDPSRHGGRSLQLGFLTSATEVRASSFKAADQSRHKSCDVLRECVRNEERFEDHAAEGCFVPALRSRPGCAKRDPQFR